MRTLLIGFALFLGGCTYATYQDGKGRTMALWRWGYDTKVGAIDASTSP